MTFYMRRTSNVTKYSSQEGYRIHSFLPNDANRDRTRARLSTMNYVEINSNRSMIYDMNTFLHAQLSRQNRQSQKLRPNKINTIYIVKFNTKINTTQEETITTFTTTQGVKHQTTTNRRTTRRYRHRRGYDRELFRRDTSFSSGHFLLSVLRIFKRRDGPRTRTRVAFFSDRLPLGGQVTGGERQGDRSEGVPPRVLDELL